MNVLKMCGDFCFQSMFVFEVPKVLQVRSKPIGVIYRTCQLLLLLYIVFYVMYYNNAYQSMDTATGGVTAKIKGIRYSKVPGTPPTHGDAVWDPTDYLLPEHMNSAIFITTRKVITYNQTYDFCEEDAGTFSSRCKVNADCKAGEVMMFGNGVKSGKCVNSTRQPRSSVCEIYAWCPTEGNDPPIDYDVIKQAENYNIVLKNTIEFSKFNVKINNILPWMSKQFLYTCRFDPVHPTSKFCPIFTLGDIVKFAQGEFSKIWIKGGMMSLHINWNCNLDFSLNYCVPEYSFKHLEDISSPLGQSLYYRSAHYHQVNGQEYRTLVKAYGIKIFFIVTGTARKFDSYIFSMNLGSSIAIFVLASLILDALAIYFLRRFELYKYPRADLQTRTIVNDWRDSKQKEKSLSTDHAQEPSQDKQEENVTSHVI